VLRFGSDAMKHLFVLVVLLLPTIAMADTGADNEMRMSVKPVLCITDERTPSCDMSFLVIWQSSDSGYYCLFSDFEDPPMRCWTEEGTGRLNDERAVESSFSYWMTGDDRELRLAEVKVEVLRMDSDDRRRKRRTRHVWDIN
jgi:hypothetical protein